MRQFSNPRLEAKFDDWPIGGGNRGVCIFKVENGGNRGNRVSRTTQKANGLWAKPKLDTYASRVCIVDGDDGKTYILKYNENYGSITINRSDFMNAEGEYYVSQNNPERYNQLLNLIVQAGVTTVQ